MEHNNELRKFFIHSGGVGIIAIAITLQLLSLPHLLQLHNHELIEIFTSEFLFFVGILLLFGREPAAEFGRIVKKSFSIFWHELRNVRDALQDDFANLLNTDIASPRQSDKK